MPCDSRLAVGTAVDVALPERFLLLGAAVVYGLPLGALIAGAVVGAMWGSDVGAAAGAALAAATTTLAIVALRLRLESALLARLAVRPVDLPRA